MQMYIHHPSRTPNRPPESSKSSRTNGQQHIGWDDDHLVNKSNYTWRRVECQSTSGRARGWPDLSMHINIDSSQFDWTECRCDGHIQASAAASSSFLPLGHRIIIITANARITASLVFPLSPACLNQVNPLPSLRPIKVKVHVCKLLWPFLMFEAVFAIGRHRRPSRSSPSKSSDCNDDDE